MRASGCFSEVGILAVLCLIVMVMGARDYGHGRLVGHALVQDALHLSEVL